MSPLYWEDIEIGTKRDLGTYTFTEEEIIRFGRMYDPQYFHVDPEAAKFSHFGGLVASGWHTVSVGHRHMVDALFAEEDRLRGLGQEPGVSGPSPGVNKMEFKVPQVPFVGMRAGLRENKIVLAPNDQRWRLLVPEPGLHLGIQG